MQLRKTLIKHGSKFPVVAGLGFLSTQTFAAAYDATESLAWIAAGVVTAGLIAAAMFGLVTLIGAAKKAQRAGT